jgi:hypothetical protein
LQGVVSDWCIIAAYPLLMLIDFLLKTPPVARALFDNLAKPTTITKVLSGVYVEEGAVDSELVDIILQPAFTPNALDVFVSVITGELYTGRVSSSKGRGVLGCHVCSRMRCMDAFVH